MSRPTPNAALSSRAVVLFALAVGLFVAVVVMVVRAFDLSGGFVGAALILALATGPLLGLKRKR